MPRIPDPRQKNKREHRWENLWLLVLLGVGCRCENFLALSQWFEAQCDWLLGKVKMRAINGDGSLPKQASVYRFLWHLDEHSEELEDALHEWAALPFAVQLFTGALGRYLVVDLDGNVLTVQRTLDTRAGAPRVSTPKTERGHRRVVLGRSALRVLDEHRVQQERQRRRLGVAWPDTGHVFVSEAGTHQNAGNLTRAFHLLQRRARARLRKRLKATLEGEVLARQLEELDGGRLFP